MQQPEISIHPLIGRLQMKVYLPRKQAKNYKKLFLKRGMRKTVTFKGIR